MSAFVGGFNAFPGPLFYEVPTELAQATSIYKDRNEEQFFIPSDSSLSIISLNNYGSSQKNPVSTQTFKNIKEIGDASSIITLSHDNNFLFLINPVEQQLVQFDRSITGELFGYSPTMHWNLTGTSDYSDILNHPHALFTNADDTVLSIIDGKIPAVVDIDRESGEHQRHKLDIPVDNLESRDTLFAISPNQQYIAATTDAHTLSIFKREGTTWVLQTHKESSLDLSLHNIGALAFSESSEHLYTVTKPSEPEQRLRQQQITHFRNEEGSWEYKGGLRNTQENPTGIVIGGTDIKVSGNKRLFISAKPKIQLGDIATDDFYPVIYYTGPATGELALIDTHGMEDKTLEIFDKHEKFQKSHIAVTDNGSRFYTLVDGHLAYFQRYRLHTPSIHVKEPQKPPYRFGSKVKAQYIHQSLIENIDGLIKPYRLESVNSNSGFEPSDFIVQGGTITFNDASKAWWSEFEVTPDHNGGDVTVEIPANSYFDLYDMPNEAVKLTFDFVASLVPEVSYSKEPIGYGETTTITIDFGQAVQEFTRDNFPWNLFDAELTHIQVLDTGYALTITPIKYADTDSVISFSLDDGLISAAENSDIKNFAIPETKILVKYIPTPL